jgi:hypothetical protein
VSESSVVVCVLFVGKGVAGDRVREFVSEDYKLISLRPCVAARVLPRRPSDSQQHQELPDHARAKV